MNKIGWLVHTLFWQIIMPHPEYICIYYSKHNTFLIREI